jgi:hypothetical protein
MLTHPFISEFIGKDVSDFKDAKGIRFFIPIANVARQPDGSFTDYFYPQAAEIPNTPRCSSKSVLLTALETESPPRGWIDGGTVALISSGPLGRRCAGAVVTRNHPVVAANDLGGEPWLRDDYYVT